MRNEASSGDDRLDPPRCLQNHRGIIRNPIVSKNAIANHGKEFPSDPHSRSINLPFPRVLLRRYDYDDNDIIRDISRGMPIAGAIGPCPTLFTRAKPATGPENECAEKMAGRNQASVARVRRFRLAALGAERLSGSMREMYYGRVSPLLTRLRPLPRPLT